MRKDGEIFNVNFIGEFGSFVPPLVGLIFISTVYHSPVSFDIYDFRNIFPILAGLVVVVGDLLTCQAFKITGGKSKIQETIVAILTNAEIIPLIFLSYFILGEFSIEGIVGAFIVFIGLSILNYAEKM